MVVLCVLLTSKKIPSETQNDANTVRLPITPATDLGMVFQPIPLIRKPISGNKGTK